MPNQPVNPSLGCKRLPLKICGLAADLICQAACSLPHHDHCPCRAGRVRGARRRTFKQLPSCYTRLAARSGSPPSSCLPHRRCAGQCIDAGKSPRAVDPKPILVQRPCCTSHDQAVDNTGSWWPLTSCSSDILLLWTPRRWCTAGQPWTLYVGSPLRPATCQHHPGSALMLPSPSLQTLAPFL